MYRFWANIQAKAKGNKLKGRPKELYYDKIITAFQRANPHAIPTDKEVAVFIYYFCSQHPKDTPDADNISKPICDALIRHAYEDDSFAIYRAAAVINIQTIDIAYNDFPDELVDLLEEKLIGEQEPVLYVNVRAYNHNLLVF